VVAVVGGRGRTIRHGTCTVELSVICPPLPGQNSGIMNYTISITPVPRAELRRTRVFSCIVELSDKPACSRASTTGI